MLICRHDGDMSTWGRIVLSLLKHAHVDWNWYILREKYLKIDWSVKMSLRWLIMGVTGNGILLLLICCFSVLLNYCLGFLQFKGSFVLVCYHNNLKWHDWTLLRTVILISLQYIFSFPMYFTDFLETTGGNNQMLCFLCYWNKGEFTLSLNVHSCIH